MSIDLKAKAFKVDDWWSENRDSLTVVSLEDALAAVEEANAETSSHRHKWEGYEQRWILPIQQALNWRASEHPGETVVDEIRRLLAASRPAPEGEVGALLEEAEAEYKRWGGGGGGKWAGKIPGSPSVQQLDLLKRLLDRLEASEREHAVLLNKLKGAQETIHLLHREKQEDSDRNDAEQIRLINERDTLRRGFEVLYNRLPYKEAVRAALALIEANWDCGNCKTKNPASSNECSHCHYQRSYVPPGQYKGGSC